MVDDGRRGEEHLAGVDWSRTRAFAIGLAGIYINIKDKYAQGIVDPGGEADRLREEIAGRLDGAGRPGERATAPSSGSTSPVEVLQGPVSRERSRPDRRLPAAATASRGRRRSAARPTPCSTPTRRPGAATTASTRRSCPASCSATGRSSRREPALDRHRPHRAGMFGAAVPDYMDGKVLTVGDARARKSPGRARRHPWPRSV